MMSGCNWLIKPSEVPTVKYSEALLVECGKAQELVKGTMQELIESKLHDAVELGACRRKHNALVKQIRETEKALKE